MPKLNALLSPLDELTIKATKNYIMILILRYCVAENHGDNSAVL